MIDSATFTLPPPGTGAATAPHPNATAQAAWLREMERAQAATWFKPHVAPTVQAHGGPSPAPADNARTGHAPTPAGQEQAHSANAAWLDHAVGRPSESPRPAPDVQRPANAALPMPQASPGQPCAPAGIATKLWRMAPDTARSGGDARTAPYPVLPVHLAVKPLVAAPQDGKPAPSDAGLARMLEAALPATSPAATTTAPRMHAQWSASGVQVWLGIGGLPEHIASQALAIVPELRRLLEAQGQQLGRVVCNGKLIFDPSAGRQPPPRVASFIPTSPQELP